jgi:hypothetical protein
MAKQPQGRKPKSRTSAGDDVVTPVRDVRRVYKRPHVSDWERLYEDEEVEELEDLGELSDLEEGELDEIEQYVEREEEEHN